MIGRSVARAETSACGLLARRCSAPAKRQATLATTTNVDAEALKSRLAKCCPGPEGRQVPQEVNQYQRMVTEFREGIQQTVELKRKF
jgi:hypothetical protein